MTLRHVGLAVTVMVVVASLEAAGDGQASPAATPPSYETYCAADSRAKRELFRGMTPEQRTTLWRTQIDRFTAAHRRRLTPEQLALMGEFRDVIPAAVASGPKTPEIRAKLEALEARLEASFTRDDQRLFDQDGPCIAVPER